MRTSSLVVASATFLGAALLAPTAAAQCCPGYTAASACAGVTLAKSRWCIQNSAPTGQAALPQTFCPYGDKVISTLEQLFNIKAPSTFEFELDTETGGAHTGTGCNALGDGVAYDAFAGNAYGATGFWGYLLSMHEAINVWTGLSSTGWPTDWWADHQSAFPNLMDFHVMNTIGVANNDQNLIKAAAAQKKRFYPGGDSADSKVVALDNVFSAMPNGDGFAGFSKVFALQSGDGVKWDGLGVSNPDVKRSEYVVAYMSLAAGKSVLGLLQGPGANGGGGICNNTPDGSGDKPYTCSEAHIDAIATAHCSAVANGKKSADLQALRSGNYANVPSASCSACPAECACDGSNKCVAPWLGTPIVSDAGTGGEGDGSIGAAGNSGTGSAGVTGQGGSDQSTGTGISAAGGADMGAAGEGHETTGGAGSLGVVGSGGASNGGPADDAVGCTCRVSSRSGRSEWALLLVGPALAVVARGRRRLRRR